MTQLGQHSGCLLVIQKRRGKIPLVISNVAAAEIDGNVEKPKAKATTTVVADTNEKVVTRATVMIAGVDIPARVIEIEEVDTHAGVMINNEIAIQSVAEAVIHARVIIKIDEVDTHAKAMTKTGRVFRIAAEVVIHTRVMINNEAAIKIEEVATHAEVMTKTERVFKIAAEVVTDERIATNVQVDNGAVKRMQKVGTIAEMDAHALMKGHDPVN